MYLKSLTALGFKSFADKTTIHFQPGITAIVGPNGCGKSNVSDAIRWVLGEQSAKALRGGEMADVIFNGTDSRKAHGMAEVSLTIGDVDAEHLKAAGVELSYNEVTVTRRVFRDGGSEYFINKTSCRLKDIQQLFMGTGMGRASYSIMAQGNITQIISSKPEDRRMVFEEAAGITKFKAQKRESLRKLELTDQNLLRLDDTIREVKRQIGSLQRQAGKARRYKSLQQELQHLDTQFARHQFDVAVGDIREREVSIGKLRAEVEVGNESILRQEDELSALREQLSGLEQQINAAQQQGLELKGQADRHESRIHFNEERLRELEAQNAQALHEIHESEERRAIAEQELVLVRERLVESQKALEFNRAALDEKRGALHRVETELTQRSDALRQTQAAAFTAAQQLARVRNEMTALEISKQGGMIRLEKLSSEKIQLEEERARIESRVAEFTTNFETEKLSVQNRRGTVEERQNRLRVLQQEISIVTQELDALVRQQADLRARLNVLEQLEQSHEGFGAGTQAALRQSQAVLGTLADKIRVSDQYVVAIEAALGHHLQIVLTEQPEAAQQILSDLASHKKGRASIAALALHQSSTVATASESFGTAAAAVVTADPAVQPLVQRLLASTIIVESLAAATAAWKQTDGQYDYVTLSGELLSRHGVFTGGVAGGSGKAPGSILGRKNQIAELQVALSRLQEQVADASRRKGASQAEQTELQASLQVAQTELRAQEVAIATAQGEFNALQNSNRVLHQKIDTVVFEIQSLAAQDAEGKQKWAALSTQLGELEERERTAQMQVGELTATQETLRQNRDAAHGDLAEVKVAVATEEQLCASYAKQQQPLEQRIAELKSLAERRLSEISGFTQRKSQFESEIGDSQSRISALQHQREQVSQKTAALLDEKSSQSSQISGREDDLRERRLVLTEVQQRRGTIEVELAQKQMTAQNLRERVQQKYGLNLDDIRSECITITFADEGQPKAETLTPEQMAAGGAATDWNAVGEQVAVLQKRIDEMGPVNLVAIEEYEETEQRHTFLSQQHADLVSAKLQLVEVINRINTQTRQMFVETFEKIRDNFRITFTEMFGGGKADLVLQQDGDVLEAGIDIVARPPGKQLQSISLLSGGEQTMTAVALLFAIYQVKPSPFCVLDELDAPLDESNISRFVHKLQSFVTHSQFVVITHNKRTISAAEILYGVTMQERGVSKIVSVKLHKAHDPATQRAGTPLVPEPEAAKEEEVFMAK